MGGQVRAVLPSVVGAGVLALVSVVVRQPGRQVPAHAARVTGWSRLAVEAVAESTAGPARRPGLRLVESSCESCRRAPGSVRVVFTDGAVFVVCPPCAGGALSVGPSHAPAGDAGGRPAA